MINRNFGALVFLCSLLAVLGCSCCIDGGDGVKTLTQEIKTETNVDVDDAGEVNGLILAATPTGNKDLINALGAVRGIKRADYEQKGDQALNQQRNYDEALKNYELAAKYMDKNFFQRVVEPDSSDDKIVKSRIYSKLGECYQDRAFFAQLKFVTEGDEQKQPWELYRKAANSYVIAAEAASGAKTKAYYYAQAANSQTCRHNRAEALRLMDIAIKLQPENQRYLKLRKDYESIGWGM